MADDHHDSSDSKLDHSRDTLMTPTIEEKARERDQTIRSRAKEICAFAFETGAPITTDGLMDFAKFIRQQDAETIANIKAEDEKVYEFMKKKIAELKVKLNTATCLWCGTVLQKNLDDMLAHAAICEKRPENELLSRIARLEAEVVEHRLQVDRLKQDAIFRKQYTDTLERQLASIQSRIAGGVKAWGYEREERLVGDCFSDKDHAESRKEKQETVVPVIILKSEQPKGERR